MEEKPFESLARGLNKDLGALLDTREPDSSKSARPIRPASAFLVSHIPFGPAHARDEFFRQRPFESLSDRFSHEIAVFPLTNHVVINRCGAFIPRSIFGSELDLVYESERNQEGIVRIAVHAKQRGVQVAPKIEFGELLRRNDPIFDIGRNPVVCGAPDASEDLDKYLYGVE